MEDTYFVAPNFINDSSNQSILSIRFATDGFSFCVHDEMPQSINNTTIPLNNIFFIAIAPMLQFQQSIVAHSHQSAEIVAEQRATVKRQLRLYRQSGHTLYVIPALNRK